MVLGGALIAGGIGTIGGLARWAIAAAGLLPIRLGLSNGCIRAPMPGLPRETRRSARPDAEYPIRIEAPLLSCIAIPGANQLSPLR